MYKVNLPFTFWLCNTYLYIQYYLFYMSFNYMNAIYLCCDEGFLYSQLFKLCLPVVISSVCVLRYISEYKMNKKKLLLCNHDAKNPLKRPSLLQWKSGFIRGMTSLKGDNLVIFYYLSATEIWLDNRGGLWWQLPYKRENTVQISTNLFIDEQQLMCCI